jgi:DNA-binding transcriptional ArsR family regulator
MDAQTLNEVDLDLRQFFTGLADAARLRIAGQLAAGDATAEALAETLGEKLAVVKHHLALLQRAGLVAGPAGAAQTYSLRLDAMHGLAAKVLGRPQTVVPEDAAADAFDRKVLKDYLTPDGRLREIPLAGRKFMAVVRYVAKSFEIGREYSEKEVNAVLERFNEDFATLRRAMIDFRWMERETDGRVYRMVGEGGG